MRFSKKLVKVGSSAGVIIDKRIAKYCNLKPGDWMEINIKKLVRKK